MARQYSVDEFLNDIPYTLSEQIDKKVSLLYDLCILNQHKNQPDELEDKVRELFASYQTERQIDNVVHDIIMENYTLNDILQRKGILQ